MFRSSCKCLEDSPSDDYCKGFRKAATVSHVGPKRTTLVSRSDLEYRLEIEASTTVVWKIVCSHKHQEYPSFRLQTLGQQAALVTPYYVEHGRMLEDTSVISLGRAGWRF